MEDAAEGVSSERPGASEQLSSVIAVVAGAAAPLGVRELDKALSEFDNASFRLDLPPAEAVLEAEIGLTRAIRETVEALLGCGSDAHRKIAVQFGERAVNRLRDAAFAVGGLLGGRASRELSQGDLALAKLALGRVARALALAGNLSAACLLWPLALSLPRAQESASLEDVGLFDLLAEFGERVTSAPDWQSAVGALEAQLCERAASRHEKASAGAAEEPPFGAVIGDDPEPPVRSGAPSISDRAAAGEGANEAAKVPTAAASSASKSEGLLRVSSSKVSQLVDLAGEIGLATGALLSREEVSASTTEGLGALAHRLENLVRELQDVSAALRLVQVGSVFQRLHRTVRDLARELGRPIRLEIRGEETEVDKLIVDRLFEPLLHMVRNAADHGLESPAERLGVGKPETGKITVSAVQQASEIHISVADDGRGLDRERILNRARERGLVEPGQEPKDDSAIWRLVLHPGFSTAEKVSALSGRGVGMDVVHSFVKDLRGRISIHSSVGKGTRFTLHVPLSLAFFQGMVFEASGMFFVIPVDSVSTVFRVSAEEVVRVGGSRGELLRLPDATVPVIWLQEFFRNVAGQREATAPTSEGRVVVVVHTAMGKLAIPTDVLMGNQQVIMKPLEGEMRAIRAAAGAGILHNGDVAIALDCERLADELRVVPTANAGSRTESYAPLG
jgi:two-component system chemotaxis sensor kinase CheA